MDKMTETPFNDLCPAEVERLAILAEECAEVIQIVGKILRHGYKSTHPDNEDGPNNREMLEGEIGHVLNAIKRMDESLDILASNAKKEQRRKAVKIEKYLHHQ